MSDFLKKIQYSLIVIAFFSITSVCLAQSSTSNTLSNLYLSTTPINPRANESVTITLSSNLLDLSSSKITWYVDGKLQKDQSGKNITIRSKSSGDETIVKAVVTTTDGITQEISTEISTNNVDLVVEPILYTPPFYKGKPTYTAEGTVKIVAMPDIISNGTRLQSKDLNFKWSKNDYVLGSNSGQGKNSIIINGTIPVRDMDITVEISDKYNKTLAIGSTFVDIIDPKILFFEDSPIYGILYNKALTDNYYLGAKEEVTIVAKPLFFSFASDTSEQANYSWTLNDTSILPNEVPNKIILKQTNGSSGTATITLNLNNISKINQFLNKGLTIEFGQ